MTVAPIVAPSYPYPVSSASMPALPTTMLSEDEQRLIMRLQMRNVYERFEMLRAERYYLGNVRVKNLRIAVPAELEDVLDIVVGWPELAVDPYVERLAIDGFRLPNATDADQDLADLASENGLDAKFSLAATDALTLGRGLWMIGSSPEPGGAPVATVESPLNLFVEWSLDGRDATTGWLRYWKDGRWHASLLVPGMTTTLAVDDSGAWVVVDRDKHGFDFVPIVRMPHKPRTTARDGVSAITRGIRSVVSSACRDLFGLEIARELYSVPGITLLGAAESDFMNSDGTAKSAWDTYITRVRALERDDEGNLPSIHQATAYDPATFTRLFEMRASQMASMVAAPPQDLGLYTQGNPVSADAVGAMETRRNRRTRRMQREFGSPAMGDVMRMLVRFANGGVLPPELRRLEVDWHDLDEVSPTVMSDAITKQIAAGSVPATSDVVLKRLGYSAIERRQLAQDREADQGTSFLQEVAHSLTAKAARVDKSLTGDVSPVKVPDGGQSAG